MRDEKGHKVRENVYWNLVVAPILGALYVIALPCITIGTMLLIIGKKVLGGIVSFAGKLLSFGWRPSEAHFAHRHSHKCLL
jgi:hypothetical protein